MPQPEYSAQYYDQFQEGARRSARLVVPIVVELLEPRSVCDVGCARGTWLSVFAEHGITDVYGIDGDYVKREELEIPVERFAPADLRRGIELDRRFDLAVCLEVAEHLPERSAAALVDGLVRAAPAVLFSGAIPGQGGRGHANEQWPEYWRELFQRHGYVVIDCIRPRVWNVRQVQFWYSQNTFLFVDPGLLDERPKLRDERERTESPLLPLVHPKLLESVAKLPWLRVKRFMDRRDAGEITQEFEALLNRWVSEA